MYSISNYKDLITEIELSKVRIDSILEQKEQLIKLMFANAPGELKAMVYSDMPKGGKNDMSLDRIVEGINRLDNMMLIEERILNGMQDAEKKIDAKLKQFEGIEYKVAYLIKIKGKTVQEVADELGYSFGYIQNLSAKVNKK